MSYPKPYSPAAAAAPADIDIESEGKVAYPQVHSAGLSVCLFVSSPDFSSLRLSDNLGIILFSRCGLTVCCSAGSACVYVTRRVPR